MNKPMRKLAVVLPFVLLGCATGGSSDSGTAPGVDFAGYRTFGLMSAGHDPTSEEPQSIRDANVRNAIRAQLVEKGYVEVDSAPDLVISYEADAYVKEEVKSPIRVGVGMGSWGGNVGGGVGASVPVGREGVVAVEETRIDVRAVDPRSNREVWLGTSTGKMKQGLDAAAVAKAVDRLMDGFPARPK